MAVVRVDRRPGLHTSAYETQTYGDDMMENIMNAVNAVMSACRESLDHTNDDYERVTILVSRVGWVQVLNDAQVMKPECLLWVGSRRWAVTGELNRLNGTKRPRLVIRRLRLERPISAQ